LEQGIEMVRYRLLAPALVGALSRGHDFGPGGQHPSAQKSSDFLFEVQPREIAPGDTFTWRWAIKGATKVLIEEASVSERELRRIGTFGASGSLEVQPKEDTSYVLSCEGSTTYSCVSVTVRVRGKKC
jgi:plastocyanin